MNKLITTTLATAACLLAFAAPTAVSATELPADATMVFDFGTTATMPLVVDFDGVCNTAVGTGAGPCDDEWSKFLWSAGACLLGTLPFGVAWKIVKSIKKAAALGGGLMGVIGAVGAYFCYDTWQNYWDWRDCSNPDGDGGGEDMAMLPLIDKRFALIGAVS